MKTYRITKFLAVLFAVTTVTSSAWGNSAGQIRRIASQYETQITSLKRDFDRVLPTPDARGKAAYLEAREAETAAEARLKEAQERHAKYAQARGLVQHAKGTWIGGAERGITRAKESLKNAHNDEARKAAEKELAKWEKNKQAGLKALAERQARLDEAERDRPEATKALEEARQHFTETRARTMEAVHRLGLGDLLTNDAFDAYLAKNVVMTEATPERLAAFAGRGREQQEIIDRMLADDDLLVQMAVADGAKDGEYGRAMEIYHDIQETSPEAAEGTLQRLALAVALEHAVPIKQRNAVADTEAPYTVDPVERYLQFEKAFLNDELDPAFANLTVWDYRMVVDGEEPNEILEWGRQMLRNYRPDHITMGDYGWRYVALVRSDIPYGSQDNKYDRDDLHFFQNILMNGGVCGRRAFIGRFILRAFGIPTTARPQRGHAALVHWTPDGWVVNLGAGWGSGWTRTAYRDDRDFLATTQARALGGHFLQVKRARWIGDVMGEKRVWGYHDRNEPEFWNGVALYIQRALIEAADSKTLAPLGEDIAEATETREKIEIAEVQITEQDRKIRVEDGVVRIPAAATSDPTGNSRGIQFMDSVLGGMQLHYSRGARNPHFEYAFQAPRKGKYALIARVATPSWQQGFLVTVNRDDEPVRMPLPHTVGLWDATEPVAVELKNGRNVLRFQRYSEGKAKGVTIKEFILVPWDRRSTVAFWDDAEAADEAPRISASLRRLLATSLLRDLAQLSSEGSLKPLPMDLTISNSRVQLLEASGSSILSFKALDGGQVGRVALDDLSLDDHALLARLMARLKPDDSTANARAAVYMESTGHPTIAEDYRRKAGSEAVERFVAMHEISAN